MPFAVTFGYWHNGNGYDARIVESSGENVFRVSADAVGTSWLTFRTQYEFGDRTGSGLDETQLIGIGEQPGMRHYDLADRTRNRFTAQADIVPSDAWTFSVGTGILKDDFSNSFYGLQDSTGRTFSLAADFHRPNGLGAGGELQLERYAGLQRSHEGDSSTAQFNDPLRDWTADSTETVNYFSIYANPPRIGRGTEIRVAYDFSHAEGSYLYTIPAGSPIPPPNQLPNVFNKLQQLHIDVRHRLSGRLAASFSYLYEPLSIYDFAFDPSVVNGIVQPSSLVLGYVYRPYTAHSVMFGLRYFWYCLRRSLMTLTTKTILPLGALALALGMPVVACGSGRGARQEGPGGLRRPEVLDVPFHSRQGRQDRTRSTASARSSPPTTSGSGSSTRSR